MGAALKYGDLELNGVLLRSAPSSGEPIEPANDNALRLTTVAQHEVPQSSSFFPHARAGVLDNDELWLSGACAPSTRQGEAQLAQAQLVNVCEIVGRNCCAEQAGGWGLPLLVAVALGRPAWAPPPTQGEIDAAAQQTGATALNNAATFDEVPVEAEIAGEVIVDAAIGVAGAAVGAGATKGAAKLLGPGTKFGTKIEGQLAKRGWNKNLVQSTIDDPVRTVVTRDTRHVAGGGRLNDPATAFYGKRGGYVVRNNRTGDIVQVSDRTDAGWSAPWD